ncbi:MAG: sensor histidine kinase N-terminal domain-containing protein [Hydrogenophaga sp.]|nr:sensor histidine kinase N-terminal domain-containing protein [Hydrogenophaga sp.]
MNAPARAADTPTPSLRIRMLRHVMLPLSLTWLIGTVATLGVASHFTERAFDRALLDDAYSIASHVETLPGGEVGLVLTPNELKAALFDQAEAVHFSVLRADGSLLAGAQLPPVRPPQPDQAFRYGNLLHQGSVVRAVVLRHEVQAQPFYIVMAHTTRVRSELVQQMLLYGALPLLVLLGLLGFALWRSIERDLAPLGRLQSALADRDAKDLTPVVIAPSTQEIEQVGLAVNDLFDRLDRSVRSQREFIGNVAHELRTPLARIRALADYGRAHPDASVSQQQLLQIATSAERAGRLVNQLLDLAIAEEADLALQQDRLALAPLVSQAVLRHLDKADARGVDLGARGLDDGMEAVCVRGTTALIEGVLDNLIDNALRYGGQTVTIELTPDARANTCVLAVVDDGPGIPASARMALRQRWTQGRDGQRLGQGSGLGLSIVARYAQLLGSELQLDSADHDRGLRASLVLRLA